MGDAEGSRLHFLSDARRRIDAVSCCGSQRMSSVVRPSSLADYSHSLSSLYLPPAAVASLPTGLLHLDGFDSLNSVSIKEGTVNICGYMGYVRLSLLSLLYMFFLFT